MNGDELKRVESTSDTLEIGTTLTTTPREELRHLILFVGSASTKDAHSIGFLTHAAYEEAHVRNRLITLRRNNDLCGFILYSLNAHRECRILQIWVRADARIIEHGRALIAWLEKKIAAPAQCWCLRCWCAEDLESNLFWPAVGFTNKNWRWGPARNARRHNLWLKQLQQPFQLDRVELYHAQPHALLLSSVQPSNLQGNGEVHTA